MENQEGLFTAWHTQSTVAQKYEAVSPSPTHSLPRPQLGEFPGTPASRTTIPAVYKPSTFDPSVSLDAILSQPDQDATLFRMSERLQRLEVAVNTIVKMLSQQRMDTHELDSKINQAVRNTQNISDSKFQRLISQQVQSDLEPLTNALQTTIVTHKTEREFISQQLHEIHAAIERHTTNSKELVSTVSTMMGQTRWVEEMGQNFKDSITQMQTFFSKDCEELAKYEDIKRHVDTGVQRMMHNFEHQHTSLGTTSERIDVLQGELKRLNYLLETTARETARTGDGPLPLEAQRTAPLMPTLAPFRPSVDMTALPPCADPLFATHTFHNASNDFKDRPSFEVGSASQELPATIPPTQGAQATPAGPSSNNKEVFWPNQDDNLLMQSFPREVQYAECEAMADYTGLGSLQPPPALCVPEALTATPEDLQAASDVLLKWSDAVLSERDVGEPDLGHSLGDIDVGALNSAGLVLSPRSSI